MHNRHGTGMTQQGRHDMTLRERQVAAVTMAVRKALRLMGLAAIKRGEFFGMRQRQLPKKEQKAA